MEKEEEKKNEKKIKPAVSGVKGQSVHTLAEDMTKVIEHNEGGLIKKIIHEQEEREEEKKNLSPESKRNQTFMFVSIILIGLALITLIVYTAFREKIFTISVNPQFSSLIFTEKTELFDITEFEKEKIAQVVFNEAQITDVKVAGVEGIYLTEKGKAVGLKKFFNLIEANVILKEFNFVSDNFLIGVAKKMQIVDPRNKPLGGDLFILLKMRSFEDIFPAMRSWEQKMFQDLHGFFGTELNSDTNYLFTKDFEDGIIQNKNARILRDKDGRIVMMYIFANDTSVIITQSEIATKEIILRLGSSRIKK